MKHRALLILLLSLPALALAEGRIGLADALRQALPQAPEQALVEARQGEAQAIQAQAEGPLAAPPALVLGSQGGRDQGGFGEYREWSAGVELPLWRSGQADAQGRLASRIDGQAREDQRLIAWELAGQLREAAWQVALAEAAVAAQEAASQEARQGQARLTRLVALGERPRADLVTLDGVLLELDTQLEVAHAELRQALATWRQVSRQEAPPAVTTETLTAERPLDELPPWTQARQSLERARAERETGVLAAKGTPALGLMARHEQSPDSPTRDALALNLSLPLPWERHRQAAEAALRYAETEAAVRLERLAREWQGQRQQAALGLEAARKQAELVQRRAQSAREELRLAGRRLEEGEMDTLDYVNVMRRTFEAERAARLGQLEVGRWIARFNQAQGVLP